MNGFSVFLLVLGATAFSVAAILGPWYLVYKIREWGCKE